MVVEVMKRKHSKGDVKDLTFWKVQAAFQLSVLGSRLHIRGISLR